jgi:hypothetical protein
LAAANLGALPLKRGYCALLDMDSRVNGRKERNRDQRKTIKAVIARGNGIEMKR